MTSFATPVDTAPDRQAPAAEEAGRARLPDHSGFLDRDGVRVAYDVYDNDAPTLLLLPTWAIVHARAWKAQIPHLARRWRLVVLEGRGNGRSDRPTDAAAYADEVYVGDAFAVLDATGTEQAVCLGWSRGAKWASLLAAAHPERVSGLFLIAPGIPFTPHPEMTRERFLAEVDEPEGWDTFNLRHWQRDWGSWVRFFHGQVFSEPHSSKPIEDATRWSMETSPETILLTLGSRLGDQGELERTIASIRCPVLVVHGETDAINPFEWGARTADLTGGELVALEGAGHAPNVREPVFVNRLIDEFAGRVTATPPRPPARRTRPLARERRVLYLSSPIGLGHARRDLAIARELRRGREDLRIDWLAQEPVTTLLRAADERVHPASRQLASESAHFAAQAREHDLHAFEALRSMDEILLSNFMVFQEVVDEGCYDLVIGDEAWDVDHFWHEDPALKRCPFVWMTDFVGALPTPQDDERRAALVADHNLEMLEHVERFSHVRDRSVFIGEPEDVVPEAFGPGLPDIAAWTRERFAFSGYVTGFDPAAVGDAAEVRAELGYAPDEQVCVVAVGGSGIGEDLIRRAIAAHPLAAARVPGLRTVVVAGPRIDLASTPRVEGLDVRAYVPDLYRHLAVCDLAIVQGGLATTMELAATRRPFLYLPLRRHFEQQIHVRHRLQRHRAGVAVDYDDADPQRLAELIAAHVGRPVDPLPVPADGAARAAALIGELL